MTEILRPNDGALRRFRIEHRFYMPVNEWNRGPTYPVKLWDKTGCRSIPGQIMREAGVKPRFLNVDNYDDNVTYAYTHIVPNDVVPINPAFGWVVDKIDPAQLLYEGRPMGGHQGRPYPLCLESKTPIKVWNLLIKLNDSNMLLDSDTGHVLHCMTWETRAFWIRELLRRFGVGIAFRLPRAS
jgi:hypothetical protein